jgi:radical SAM superfamily enzyme YgiQ (UPF0313 family)
VGAPERFREVVRRRLRVERGAIVKQAPFMVALCYPSPYAAAMSSLGYQRVYRALQELDGVACERAFLDDDAERALEVQARPLTYESLRPVDDLPMLAFSVAYELEIGGMVRMLDAAGVPALRSERNEGHPFVLAGGPLTFSNPLPLAPIADAVVIGEAEDLIEPVVRAIERGATHDDRLDSLARLPHVFVPARHGELLPEVAKAADERIPAWAPIRTPEAHLSDMFLIETERGCSRSCTYCVMRRSTNGGMRLASMEKILSLIPEDARRVGLVGAAVSDHPRIVNIVDALAARGCEVGLSSLRPDRLSEEFVSALARAGHRTLTTAMDGPSERLRATLERRTQEKNLVRAAERARANKMSLKLYLMLGLPTETDEDIDECARFVGELSKVVPISLGVAPFCAKRNTPLDGQPFAGIDVVEGRVARLRRGLRGRAEVRSVSAKWAWVEYVLAQGASPEGVAAVRAAREGGSFAAWRKAFSGLEPRRVRRALAIAPT